MRRSGLRSWHVEAEDASKKTGQKKTRLIVTMPQVLFPPFLISFSSCTQSFFHRACPSILLLSSSSFSVYLHRASCFGLLRGCCCLLLLWLLLWLLLFGRSCWCLLLIPPSLPSQQAGTYSIDLFQDVVVIRCRRERHVVKYFA